MMENGELVDLLQRLEAEEGQTPIEFFETVLKCSMPAAFGVCKKFVDAGIPFEALRLTEGEYYTKLILFAASFGNPRIEESDLDKAIQALPRLQKEGYEDMALLCLSIGKAYYSPTLGFLDYKKALKYFLKARSYRYEKESEKGAIIHRDTLFYLVHCYHFGRGTAPNEEKAEYYFEEFRAECSKYAFYTIENLYEYEGLLELCQKRADKRAHSKA